MDYINSACSHIISAIRVSKDKISEYTSSDGEAKKTERLYPTDGIEYMINQHRIAVGPPTHIVDNIYLGSAFNAANKEVLQRLDIKVIINISRELSNYHEDDFEYFPYKINDSEGEDITQFLEESYQAIKGSKDKNILIHCYMGASRSASLVLYYLMREKKLSFDDALALIKEKRSSVNPNVKFVEALKKQETECMADFEDELP